MFLGSCNMPVTYLPNKTMLYIRHLAKNMLQCYKETEKPEGGAIRAHIMPPSIKSEIL